MKTLFALLMAGLFSIQLLAAQNDPTMKTAPSMNLDEIAALTSLAKVEALAKSKGIPYERQTNETMKARLVPEYRQSMDFIAVGRLVLTFWLKNGSDTVTVHVSFFHDGSGHILGRSILMENNNVP